MHQEALYVSPEQAAQILNFHRKTIYRMVKAGTLPHTRVGRDIRIPKKALDPNSFVQRKFHPTKKIA